MDDIDRAQEREAEFIKAAIEASLAQAAPNLRFGICNYCNEHIAATATFCDAECREEYEIEQEREARKNGARK